LSEAEFDMDVEGVPYGDDVWHVDDGIDLECHLFSEENELGAYMEQGLRKRPRPNYAVCRTLDYGIKLITNIFHKQSDTPWSQYFLCLQLKTDEHH
jgi:hypothetical protein